MNKCRACGAEINWVKMRSGRMIPVDPLPVYIVEGSGGVPVITETGTIANGIPCVGSAPADKRIGWVSHFSTCPHADRIRRRG